MSIPYADPRLLSGGNRPLPPGSVYAVKSDVRSTSQLREKIDMAIGELNRPPGVDVVRENLKSSVIGAANLAEVLTKMTGSVERSLAEAVLVANGVRIEPVSAEDARLSAEITESVSGLSLEDRLCLALAAGLDDVALTADSAWGEGGRVRRIR